MSPAVSIVIPTKNAGALFEEVMAALAGQHYDGELEIIVIDSGSSDATMDIARRHGASVHEIAAETFNHGATRDLGISLGRGDIAVLLTQDATPADTGMVARLAAAFDDPRVAGAYARQIPRPDADVLTRKNLNTWLTGRQQREVRCIDDLPSYEDLSPLDKYLFCNFDNVCSAVRKAAWEIHRFGHVSFGEDIDWAERVLKDGHKIVYEPGAVVIHSHDRSLWYEYKRTYLCHRKLYRQFALVLVPSIRHALYSWFQATLADELHVMRNEASLATRIRLMIRIPALNLLSAIGQYKGVKDELAGADNRLKGI